MQWLMIFMVLTETEVEAAEAYDIAAIKYKGHRAITNFETSRYDVKTIMSTKLPIGGREELISAAIQDADNDEHIAKLLKDAANAQVENDVNEPLTDKFSHSNASATLSNAAREQPVLGAPLMVRYQKLHSATQPFMPTNNNNVFLYNLMGLETRAFDEHGISKTMASTHRLVMGDSSLPSHSSLAAQFIDTQEGLVASKIPASGNMLSAGTFTRREVCSPEQPSGIVRADYENVTPRNNWMASSLQYPESGPFAGSASQAPQSEPIAETACQAPLMFNIWSDIRMSRS